MRLFSWIYSILFVVAFVVMVVCFIAGWSDTGAKIFTILVLVLVASFMATGVAQVFASLQDDCNDFWEDHFG